MDLIRSHVMVCGGTNCSSSASGEIIREFERQIAEKGLEKEIKGRAHGLLRHVRSRSCRHRLTRRARSMPA